MKLLLTPILFISVLFSSLALAESSKSALTGEAREEMKRILRELIERNVKTEMGLILEEKGFKTGSVEEILQGKSMARFAQRVSHHPKVLEAIEGYLNALIDETKINDRLSEEAVSQKVSHDAALKNYLILRARSLQIRRKQQTSPSLWTRFWNQTKQVLFDG